MEKFRPRGDAWGLVMTGSVLLWIVAAMVGAEGRRAGEGVVGVHVADPVGVVAVWRTQGTRRKRRCSSRPMWTRGGVRLCSEVGAGDCSVPCSRCQVRIFAGSTAPVRLHTVA